ncbi:MAG: hypothetical protein M1814_005812 [Vezdaea aestivalis]|nr:MAG: hypothetical protein M1814_005812 [Vezdaea aestivalis]
MAESPPKRMTRARAAKVAIDTTITKPKGRITTKIATASTKVAVEEAATVPVKPKPAARRKAKTENDSIADTQGNQEPELPVKKPAARRKAQAVDEVEQDAQEAPAPAPKPRGRPRKTVATEPVVESSATRPRAVAPKSVTSTRAARTQPKRAVAAVLEDPFVEKVDQVPVRKATRARAAAMAMTKSVAAKKKVAFVDENDDSDKENRVPTPPKRETRAVAPRSGIRAKPVRKAAASTAGQTRTARRVKAAVEQESTAEKEVPISKPLSPKKVTQVGATSQEAEPQRPSSRDKAPTPIEVPSPRKVSSPAKAASPIKIASPLKDVTPTKTASPARATSPVRNLAQSPKKNPSPAKRTHPETSSHGLESDFDGPLLQPSSFSTSLLASPARRVPTSPFKDAMKESAKKPRDTEFQDSLLAQQPFKAPTSGPLFQSKSAFSVSTPSFRSSLLSTPARRPPQTAGKLQVFKTPLQSSLFQSRAPATAGPRVHTVRLPEFPAAIETASSAFKSCSPGKTPRIHNITPPRTEVNVFEDLVGLSEVGTSALKKPMASVSRSRQNPVLKSALKSAKRQFVAGMDGNISPTKIVKIDEGPPTRYMPEKLPKTPVAQLQLPEKHIASIVQQSSANKHFDFTFSTPATVYPEDDDLGADDTLFFTPVTKVFDLTSAKKNKGKASAPSTPRRAHSSGLVQNSLKRKAHDSSSGEAADSSAVATRKASPSAVSMTPLLSQLEGWSRTSPEKRVRDARHEERRGLFAYEVPVALESDQITETASPNPHFFDDEIVVCDVLEDHGPSSIDNCFTTPKREVKPASPPLSPASQIYGDENVAPAIDSALIDPTLVALDSGAGTIESPTQSLGTENPTPATTHREFSIPVEVPTVTPARLFARRVAQTVSKVPLKPAAGSSPEQSNIRRRMSVSGPVGPQKLEPLFASGISKSKSYTTNGSSAIRATSCSPKKTTRRARKSTMLTSEYSTPSKPGPLSSHPIATPTPSCYTMVSVSSAEASPLDMQVPHSQYPSPAMTAPWTPYSAAPLTTPRRLSEGILKGATVFVDVHTAEGADASGIFVDLLTSMGARCVKSWSWNPRAFMAPQFSADETPALAKVGITHVVYKDGGRRTLEKVRAAIKTGVPVACVGVGWVLDCEREGVRLPEALYDVDTSTLPRGGHRRRKSMEPRALANLNGTLFTPSRQMSKSPKTPSPAAVPLPPASEAEHRFLNQDGWAASPLQLSSPVDAGGRPMKRRSSGVFVRTPLAERKQVEPETPWDPSRFEDLPPLPLEPVTPGPPLDVRGLSMRTCPPKKEGEDGFPVSGRIEDFNGDEGTRRRLILARKRSLQFVPKIGSPLAKGT